MWPFSTRKKTDPSVEYPNAKLYWRSDFEVWETVHELGPYDLSVYANPLPADLPRRLAALETLIAAKHAECLHKLQAGSPEYKPYDLSAVSLQHEDGTWRVEITFTSDKWPDAGWDFVYSEDGTLIEEHVGD